MSREAEPVKAAISLQPLVVQLFTNVSSRRLNFIIDTGSNYSFVKLGSVTSFRHLIDHSKVRKLSGIGSDIVTTLGVLDFYVHVDDVCVKYEFNILDDYK